MTCYQCHQEFSPNEIDLDGHCYRCANPDEAEQPDLVAVTIVAAKSALKRIEKRLKRKLDDGGSN